eukprot:1094029-Amphidinium_carterae.1
MMKLSKCFVSQRLRCYRVWDLLALPYKLGGAACDLTLSHGLKKLQKARIECERLHLAQIE